MIVLNTSPAHAAFLMIFVGLAGILGRFSITALIEPLGRRGAGTLYLRDGGDADRVAGYLYDVFIGTWSLFYMLIVAQGFFSSAIYTVVGPYMSEIWPARLRTSGMGMSYGVGNLGGKVLGRPGLALIMGAGDIIKPAAPNLECSARPSSTSPAGTFSASSGSGCSAPRPRAVPSRRWTRPWTRRSSAGGAGAGAGDSEEHYPIMVRLQEGSPLGPVRARLSRARARLNASAVARGRGPC